MLRHSQLAILGGRPVREKPFPPYRTIGEEERRAVNEVVGSGILSQFLGTWGSGFYGGPRVRALEQAWADRFGVKHAVAMNSATSGLYACLGAAGLGPGDEVIVPPYTMSASVTGVLLYGATPIFVDIDPQTYCLSPEAVREAVTPRTKAIVAVDLFGHPAEFDAIAQVARDRRLTVIEDAAQAPGAQYHGRWAGTLGHLGVFSLNCHKTIQCGEGGVVVTGDDELANRLCLIRNHAEAVVKEKRDDHLAHLVGFNFRMTELEAAIASEQLKKLEALTVPRIEAAEFLRARWSTIPGLTLAWVQPGCRHVYYVFAVQHDAAVFGVPRSVFVEAVRAEGVPLTEGYVEPLYLQPIYQRRPEARAGLYARGRCPVAERMHRERLWYTTLIHPGLSPADLTDVALAVEKVASEAHVLASRSRGAKEQVLVETGPMEPT
jgi:dTDP-4-amino-4,6-dideoxygalactose transaminase